MTTSKKTAGKRSPKGMKANKRIIAAIDATGAKRAKGTETAPILSGSDAVKALQNAKTKVTDTIDAGGGIMVDIVEKVSPEQKVANAAGEALATTPAAKGKRKPWRERAAVINAEHREKVEAELKTEAKADGKMSGLDAAAKILAEAEMPLNAKMIVERMIAQGLWTTGGKTPSSTIYSAMLREIDVKPGESRFKKVDRGLFTLDTPKT